MDVDLGGWQPAVRRLTRASWQVRRGEDNRMLNETVFRTEDLPGADRFDYWCERIGRTHAPLDLYSAYAADYQAHQRVLELGALHV